MNLQHIIVGNSPNNYTHDTWFICLIKSTKSTLWWVIFVTLLFKNIGIWEEHKSSLPTFSWLDSTLDLIVRINIPNLIYNEIIFVSCSEYNKLPYNTSWWYYNITLKSCRYIGPGNTAKRVHIQHKARSMPSSCLPCLISLRDTWKVLDPYLGYS